MEAQINDQECLYESLPETCDTSSTLNDMNLASSSLNEETSSSLSSENPLQKEVSLESSVKKCVCRESVQWTWDKDSKSEYVEVVNDSMDVRFHRNYSNGTAVVRCTEPMSNNQYYWEVKMTCPVYGTDIMVGVGTSEAKLKHLRDRFVSLLGMDNKTWGFSYTGLFHHNGQRRCYSQSFGQGNIIGVHLDLWKGTLSFYKDRKNLGVASTGLKGKTLYAMASSTAARSGMRIVKSCSFPSSLQFLCCAKLREVIPDEHNVLDVVNIPPGLKQFLSSKLSWLLDKRHIEQDFNTCCNNEEIPSDDEVADESPAVNGIMANETVADPYSISGQLILLGSVLLSNHNRFQRAVTVQNPEEREDSSESEAKRRRYSYNFTVGLSDQDSD